MKPRSQPGSDLSVRPGLEVSFASYALFEQKRAAEKPIREPTAQFASFPCKPLRSVLGEEMKIEIRTLCISNLK